MASARGGATDQAMLFLDRQLTGGERGACAVPVFEDFQQVTALFGGQFDPSPVIEDEELGSRQGVDEFGIASVVLGDSHVLEESGQAQVEGGVSLPAGAVRQGASEPGFTDAGGAGDEDIEGVTDPLADGQ